MGETLRSWCDSVSAAPHVSELRLRDGDEFAVVACDGLFDVMSSQAVVDFVRERFDSNLGLGEVCEALVRHAIDTLGTRDNVSVIIARFVPSSTSFAASGSPGSLSDLMSITDDDASPKTTTAPRSAAAAAPPDPPPAAARARRGRRRRRRRPAATSRPPTRGGSVQRASVHAPCRRTGARGRIAAARPSALPRRSRPTRPRPPATSPR